MRSLNQALVNRARRFRGVFPACASAVEQLESRVVLNAAVTGAVPTQTVIVNTSPATINLNQFFNDPNVTGTAVLMQTNEGNIPIALDDSAVPNTVTNFLDYVTGATVNGVTGSYVGTIIHRVNLVSDPGSLGGLGVIQGGGLLTNGTAAPTYGPIALEGMLPNTQYTIAMARQSSPDTATNQFFFNTVDNSASLQPGIVNGQKTGYAVFGMAIYGGQTTLNTISGLSRASLTGTAFGDLTTVPTTDGNTGTATPADEVIIEATSVVSALTYSVSSDNPAVANPSVSGNNLSLNTGQVGTANITIRASDLGGNMVSSSFSVMVDPVPPPTVATLGTGAAHAVKFKDPNGTNATAFLTGPGGGTITLVGTGLTESTSKGGVTTVSGIPSSVTIDATGTTSATTVNVQSPSGRPLLISEISTDGDVRTISAAKVALTGNVTIGGSVGSSVMLDTLNSGTFTVNGSSGAFSLVLSTSSAENIASSEAISSLQATSLTGSPTINVPSIGRVNITGQIAANITAGTLGPLTAGIIGSSTWTISGAVGNITTGGINGLNLTGATIGRITSRQAINGSTVISAADITAIAAAVFSGSKFEAASPTFGSNGIPTAFGSAGTITSVVVGRGGFSNSVIAAPTLGNLALGATPSSNGGTPFGVAAHTIAVLTARIDGKLLSLRNVMSEAQVTVAESKAGITANDLFIQIV